MKKSKFTEEQIVAILSDAEKRDGTIIELCEAHGISETTYYKWRTKYGGLEEKELKRLRELEVENSRLKKVLAERVMEIDIMRSTAKKLNIWLPGGDG